MQQMLYVKCMHFTRTEFMCAILQWLMELRGSQSFFRVKAKPMHKRCSSFLNLGYRDKDFQQAGTCGECITIRTSDIVKMYVRAFEWRVTSEYRLEIANSSNT